MVKVLENQVIDLDLLPGKQQQELKALAQAQVDSAGWEEDLHLAQSWMNAWSFQHSNQVKIATDQLPPEQRKQAEGLIGSAANVATGVAGTAGGAVKGLVDTTGNTVCALKAEVWRLATVEGRLIARRSKW